jgi:hypothetical protein
MGVHMHVELGHAARTRSLVMRHGHAEQTNNMHCIPADAYSDLEIGW